jgi:hypothetical protein
MWSKSVRFGLIIVTWPKLQHSYESSNVGRVLLSFYQALLNSINLYEDWENNTDIEFSKAIEHYTTPAPIFVASLQDVRLEICVTISCATFTR